METTSRIIDINGLLAETQGRTPEELAATHAPRAALTLVGAPSGDVSVGATPLAEPEAASAAAQCARTELGVAERWAMYCGSHWRWTWMGEDAGYWRRWDGRLWRRATDGDLVQTLVAVIRDGMQRLELPHLAPAQDIREGEDPLRVAREDHFKVARSFETASRLRAIGQLLRAIPGISVPADAWDSDDDILNARDGIVDLRTGELRPHDPAAMCTMIAAGSGRSDVPLTADIHAVLDAYDQTNDALSSWWQTVAGVAITGHAPRLAQHTHGVANAGKTTLAEALLSALGGAKAGLADDSTGYAVTVNVDALQPLPPGAPRESLAPAEGRRVVLIDEASHARIDANLVKSVASGGLIATRSLYGKARTWRSRVTLLLSGNDPLSIPSTDGGLADRLYGVELTYAVPPEQRDHDLAHRLQGDQENLDSLLAWAIRGAIAWYGRGGGQAALCPPAYVAASRQRYVDDANPLRVWLDDCVEVLEEPATDGNLARCATIAELRRSYARWCRQNGVKPVATRAVPAYLAQAGHPVDDGRTTSRAGEVGNGRTGRFVRTLGKPADMVYTGDY